MINCVNTWNQRYRISLLVWFIFSHHTICFSQVKINPVPSVPVPAATNHIKALNNTRNNLFGAQESYIRNMGQYGNTYPGFEDLGKLLFAYEGMDLPVLFTARGVLHLQRKKEKSHYRAKEERENKEKDREAEKIYTVSTEWIGANTNPEVEYRDELPAYYTYLSIPGKAKAYKTVVLKNMYPGIDVVYSILQQEKPGFEYSLVVRPGADISKVQMKIGGDLKKVSINKKGELLISAAADSIVHTVPLCFNEGPDQVKIQQPGSYRLEKNVVSFQLPGNIDASKTLIIDPFVSITGSLTGVNAGKAKDIDFDYEGNIYVSGGGDGGVQKLAKFSPAGVLLWTFSGVLSTPSWSFGGSYGGWVVDKGNGSIYMGQGLASSGFSVIRLTTDGVYNNYKTVASSSFLENWKMIWSCNGGSPDILIAGGGGSANNELAVLSRTSLTPVASNLSGLSGGHNDISDIVIDPVSNEMFTIYSRPVTGIPAGNTIYKHKAPYNSTSIAWQFLTPFNTLTEPSNRPYMAGLDNSSNCLAVNSRYLFYWDGKNLAAYLKTTGAPAGSVFIFSGSAPLSAGGLFADECGNVFIGFLNGVIKVLRFDGISFDDAVMPDITIAGATGQVYDMAYDNGKKLLYASGNGFVTSIDLAVYCPTTHYTINIDEDCSARTIKATVSPVPSAGITLSYNLYDGTTLVGANTDGIFTGLNTGVLYTVKAYLNQACSGTEIVADFQFSRTVTLITNSPAPICLQNGTADLTLPAVTAGSETGLTFTYWLDADGTQACPLPTAVKAGTYYIRAASAQADCPLILPVVVPSLPAPVAIAGTDTEICFGQNAQLHGSGGVSYTWSPVNYLDDPFLQHPTLIKPRQGIHRYQLTVTDANGCNSIAPAVVTVNVTPVPKIGLPTDTIIVRNQPLQLEAVDIDNRGFVNYVWSPSTGLNSTVIKDPVAVIDRDIIYRVEVITNSGCMSSASIIVKVYDQPDVFVPTAFTPNADGRNDILKAIPAGIKEFRYFSVYNRWGQLVFTTTDPRIGWDGRINGTDQGTGVFVWITEAVDYKGNVIWKKGQSTLIR